MSSNRRVYGEMIFNQGRYHAVRNDVVRGAGDDQVQGMAIEIRSATDVLDKLKGFKEKKKLTGCGVIRHINVDVEFANN